jgi:quinol monooxygenase YgiN
MRYTIGRIWTRPGQRGAYLEESEGYNAFSRSEDGCLYYEQAATHHDPDGVTLVECWQTVEQHAAHLARPERASIGPIFEKYVLRATFEEMDADVKPIVVDLSK